MEKTTKFPMWAVTSTTVLASDHKMVPAILGFPLWRLWKAGSPKGDGGRLTLSLIMLANWQLHCLIDIA